MKESTPLKWPEGWPRTRPQDQKKQSQWKKPYSFYLDKLEEELKRMGTVSSQVTSNGSGDRDPGVAVWFSRTRKEDFSWQDALEIRNPYPNANEIDSAYRRLAQRYHPDNRQTGDVAMFHKIADARARAMDWVNRKDGTSFDYAIACDTFEELRLNVAALWQSIKHIRGLERCGTSALLEKSFEGFKQLTEGKHVVGASA